MEIKQLSEKYFVEIDFWKGKFVFFEIKYKEDLKELERNLFQKCEKEKDEREINFMVEKVEFMESYKFVIYVYEVKIISI